MTQSTEPFVEFGDLPPKVDKRGGNEWPAVVEALRAAPGKWARVRVAASVTQANNTAQNIKRGLVAAFRPQGSFEAVRRDCDVWARYVGERS